MALENSSTGHNPAISLRLLKILDDNLEISGYELTIAFSDGVTFTSYGKSIEEAQASIQNKIGL